MQGGPGMAQGQAQRPLGPSGIFTGPISMMEMDLLDDNYLQEVRQQPGREGGRGAAGRRLAPANAPRGAAARASRLTSCLQKARRS